MTGTTQQTTTPAATDAAGKHKAAVTAKMDALGLPQATAEALVKLQGSISSPGTKLGQLARALGHRLRDYQDDLQNYGAGAVLALAGDKVPVRCSGTMVLTVEVEGRDPLTYSFDLPAQKGPEAQK